MMFEAEFHGGGYGTTLIHRCPAGVKLLVLTALSIVLFTYSHLWFILAVLFSSFGLYLLSGFSAALPLRQVKPLAWLFALLFIFSIFSAGLMMAAIIVLRLICLFFLANLITLTTPLSVMMACFERIFVILKPFGCNPAKIALVFSLTLRFIPLLNRLVLDVRQAQAARGLERSLIASFVPAVILMLKMSEDIANALEARGFDA